MAGGALEIKKKIEVKKQIEQLQSLAKIAAYRNFIILFYIC